MSLWRLIGETIIEALFPLDETEQRLRMLPPEAALLAWPKAPDYSGLVVPLPEAHSLWAYKYPEVSQTIWCLKYKKAAWAATVAGLALYRSLPGTGAIVIPLPSTARRRRERGFNQCELMLEAMKQFDKQNLFLVDNTLLKRVHHTRKQAQKNRAERISASRNLFAVNESAAIILRADPNKSSLPLIVIDDVITTGVTMRGALDALQAAGFQNVRALSLAH